MYSKRDHLSDASQTSIENQVDLNTVLGHKLLESAERFLSLQGYAWQAFVRDANDLARRLLAANSPQQLTSLVIDEAQAASRNALAYSFNAASLAVGTQSELMDVLGTQIGETNFELTEMIADISRSAPGGTGRVVNLLRILLGQVSAGCEQLTQLVKQALDLMETSLLTAGRQFGAAAGRTTAIRVAQV